MKQERARLPLRMEEATKAKMERWCSAADCRSMNEFVEKAINFYANYLELQDKNTLLPTAIQTAVDGRLSMTEDRLSSILFKNAVELDMLSTLIAAGLQLDDAALRRLRTESVKNVRRTNGQLSFAQKVRESPEEDEWQD